MDLVHERMIKDLALSSFDLRMEAINAIESIHISAPRQA